MKILILGGTGAMGGYLVSLLSESHHDIYVTSRAEHKSTSDNVHYIQGNAHDIDFLRELLSQHFDIVVDFMVYNTREFLDRYKLLLEHTGQYIFLSSARVYASSPNSLIESDPRLLDVCKDSIYLQTDEYALAKARQENLLRGGVSEGISNWTIVRPYITYSSNRLQLGVYEKEAWLLRVLHDRTVVLPRELASCTTTLTWGKDVAQGIAYLVGNEKALGESVHIASNECLTWEQIIEIYQNILSSETDYSLKIHWIENDNADNSINQYRLKYDRLYDRKFDSSKIIRLSNGKLQFTNPKDGLRKCLHDFLKNPSFKRTPCFTQAWMDRITHERISLNAFPHGRDKIKYMALRYAPQNVFEKFL